MLGGSGATRVEAGRVGVDRRCFVFPLSNCFLFRKEAMLTAHFGAVRLGPVSSFWCTTLADSVRSAPGLAVAHLVARSTLDDVAGGRFRLLSLPYFVTKCTAVALNLCNEVQGSIAHSAQRWPKQNPVAV